MKEVNSLKSKTRIPYVAVEMRIKEVVPGRVLCQSGGGDDNNGLTVSIQSYDTGESL